MNENQKCPVCMHHNLIPVREVPTARTARNIVLYYCTVCRSFCNPSGYVEDEAQLKADLDWNIGKAERNTAWAKDLFNKILLYKPDIKTVLEVGCGIGTALKVANEDFGLNVVGYDTNKKAVNWGRDNYSLSLHSELWRSEVSPPSDLTLCLSVLEHIEQPRPLIHELCKHTKVSRGLLFISVPFLEPYKWHFIDNPDPTRKSTPFFDNDVHITHFSWNGLFNAIKDEGLSCRAFRAGGWNGLLVYANPDLKERASNWLWSKGFRGSQSLLVGYYMRSGKGSKILQEALQNLGL